MVVLVTDKAKLEGNRFSVLLPDAHSEATARLLEKRGGYLHITIGLPQKDKSTGPRSENNWIHGSCSLMAEQLGYSEELGKAQGTEYVKDAMKRMAVGLYGYPTVLNHIDGHEEPMSLAYASSEQAQMVINTILDFCALQGLWLIRYVDDVPEAYWVQSGLSIDQVE